MSPSTALTTRVESGSPYQLNHEQVLKASKALLKHMKAPEKEKPTENGKKSLLATADEEDTSSIPIWLNLTTKKHITDQKSLKPSKIHLPHGLNDSPTTTICLITADPQRTYKDIVASPAFPAALRTRISKVVGIDKIRKKWTQYEAQRKLFAEHDIFLADDRIVTQLPRLLGKTFYKSTVKRPIPVSIQAPAPKTDGKRIAHAKGDGPRGAAAPKDISREIEKAIQSALVSLSPSTATSLKVGYAGWEAEKLAENIEEAVNVLVEKFVPKKWRGVKSFHIKGPATMALPIWLADELWVEEADVLHENDIKKIQEAGAGKKRKKAALEDVTSAEEGQAPDAKKEKKRKLVEGNDDKLDMEIQLRKEKLKKQKAEAAQDGEDAIVNIVKKSSSTKGKKGVLA